jgi:hypothetical protein
LVVVTLPQAAVALVGNGKDVRRQLAQVMRAILLHGAAIVQAGDGLVGVHRGDDGADVSLQAHGGDRAALPRAQQRQASDAVLLARARAPRNRGRSTPRTGRALSGGDSWAHSRCCLSTCWAKSPLSGPMNAAVSKRDFKER